MVDQILETITIPNVDLNSIKEAIIDITKNYTIQINECEDDVKDLEDKINLYLYGKKIEGLASNTLKDYGMELRRFKEHVKRRTSEINSNDIRGFLNAQSHLKRNTIIKKLDVIRGFFGWLVNEELITSNPVLKIKTPKSEKRLNTFFNNTDLEKLRDACMDLRQRATIEMFYATGCRLSEIANLKIKDINLENLSAKIIGKGNKERIIYIDERAAFHLKKYLESRTDDCEYAFVTHRRPIRRMSPDTMQADLKKILINSKVERNITFHDFRRSLASRASEANMDIAVIQQLLGHESPDTTLIYANISEQRKETEYRRLMS